MRFRLGAIGVLLLATACTGPAALPVRPDAPSRVRATSVHAGTSYRYYPLATGARVDAWTKPDRTRAPWLVYVHGGAWYAGAPDAAPAVQLASHALRRGYQFFSAGYRLSGVARWPAQRLDVAAAVDWIRTNADALGVDPDRGVVIGESAGGHLAAVEASRGLVAGAVDLAGVATPMYPLPRSYGVVGAAALKVIGCLPAACPAQWADADAVTRVNPRTAPMLVGHSRSDPIVPVWMSQNLAAALRAAGRPVTLVEVDGNAHAILFDAKVLDAVDAFTDRVTARG